MKKIQNVTKKLISILLLCSLTFSVVACNGTGNSGNNSGSAGESTSSDSVSSGNEDNEYNATGRLTYDLSHTLHVYDVADGTKPLVQNGKCDYTIVYPAAYASDSNIATAIGNLRNYIKESTGISIPAKTDAEKNDSSKIISLYATVQSAQDSAASTFYAQYKSQLNSQGYVIKTSGDSVYLMGNGTLSIAYASYEFLHWQFGYEGYSSTVYDLERNVSEMSLKEFNLVDVPDLESRSGSYSVPACYRQMSEANQFNATDGNSWCHNWSELLPQSKYGKDHPEWYGGIQLCLEAGGDAESRQEMIDAVYEEMRWRLETDPTKDWIAFSHEDGGTWCGCAACTKDIGLYDDGIKCASFASLVRFTNEVAAKIKKWNEENCPDRNIIIFIYRYGKPLTMPVKLDANKKPVLDENGNYQPYSDDLVIADNVGVIYCGFGNGIEYIGHPDITDPDSLKRITDCMVDSVGKPRIYFWVYSAIFRDYITPASYIDTRQDYYQFCVSQGGVAMLDMGRYSTTNGTDWTDLKAYISAKLMWNCQADVQELTKNYMKACFGDASETMTEMYQESRVWKKYLVENGVALNTASSASAKNYPLGVIKKFQAYIEQAYRDIETYRQTDKELYEVLSTNILRESLTWRYLEIKLYPSSWSGEELKNVQSQFLTDCATASLTEAFEHSNIAQLFG